MIFTVFFQSFNRPLVRNLSQIREEIIIRIRGLSLIFKVFKSFSEFLIRSLSQIREEIIIRIRGLSLIFTVFFNRLKGF